MEFNETLNEGLKRAYAIKVTAQELDDKVNEKLSEAQPDIEMKGFRKGKVPMALLKKQFGQRVLGEAMQETIDGAMSSHFEASGDRPAAQPDVKMTNEDWKEGDDIHVEMSYERLPDIPEVDVSDVDLERLVVTPGEDKVQEALERLASSNKNFESRRAGSKAKAGDQVVFDFEGKVDGVAFEGGKAEEYPLELGSGTFIPGFEDQLIGVKKDQDIDVTVTFPEDYGNAELAGKDAVFTCKIKDVKGAADPVIDDEMAKKFGSDTLDELKTSIKERLANEFSDAARMVTKRQLLDALDGLVSFDLPPSMVEQEAKQIAHQMWHDENPDVEGHDHPEIETTDEHNKLAERRVRLGLLLAEIGQREEIEVSEQEMTQAIIQQARQFPGQEREFFDFIRQNAQMQQQLRAPIFEDKVCDTLIGKAKVTDKETDQDGLDAAVKALDEV